MSAGKFQEGALMTPIVPPTGGPEGPGATPARGPRPTGSGFAEVYDFEAARAARPRVPRIPPAVLDDIAAADRLYETLRAQGHEVRFALPGEEARVIAELRTVDGRVVRTVSLSEIIGAEPPVPTTDPAA
jgi:hypothetical protein